MPSSNKSNKFTISINLNIEIFSIERFSDEYIKNFADIEFYHLNITESDQENNNFLVNIETKYLNGLLRAFETLSQILNFDSFTRKFRIYNLPLEIHDKPSFAYRGVMIDTSRHFIELDKIKKILDGMLFSKLNILHWHLTDDEYFSLNFSAENLKLIRNSRYAYSKEDIKEINDYAYLRGITIIPEIDVPAHTRSWKDLNTTNISSDIVISKDEVGILNPSISQIYNLIIDILETTSDYFQIDKTKQMNYLHLGGDEIDSKMWDREDIKEFMRLKNIENLSDLENYFFNKINKKLHNKFNTDNINAAKFIYWVDDNIKRYYDVYYEENSILMYWGLNNNLKKFIDNYQNNLTKNDNKTGRNPKNIIITSGDYLYMDCGFGNKYGDGTWCGDYKTWKTIYSMDIFKNYNNFNVLGAQISLFGELADNFNIVSKIFPRAFSLSEKLWNYEYNKEIDSDKNKELFVKINNHNKRVNARGVGSISITCQLCENEPELCIGNIK